jgi:predicted nucleic acid-binding protein
MCVTKNGKLRTNYLPAIYFDSSVLIDYWITEGLEVERTEDPIEKLISENEPKSQVVIRELLKADKRLNKVIELRKKLIFGQPKLTSVISPLSLLELMEWNAATAFADHASETVGMHFIQRRSKKDIGGYLKKLLDLRRDEVEKQKGTRDAVSTGLEILMSDTWLNRSFAECHGLEGLLQADIVNFNLTLDQAWREPSAYAYLQLGLADIMHILLACHLGCTYFASFDNDFCRARDIIEKESKMKVLTNAEEILGVL